MRVLAPPVILTRVLGRFRHPNCSSRVDDQQPRDVSVYGEPRPNAAPVSRSHRQLHEWTLVIGTTVIIVISTVRSIDTIRLGIVTQVGRSGSHREAGGEDVWGQRATIDCSARGSDGVCLCRSSGRLHKEERRSWDDAMSTVNACARVRAPTHLFTPRWSSMAVIDNEIQEIAAFKAPTVYDRIHSRVCRSTLLSCGVWHVYTLYLLWLSHVHARTNATLALSPGMVADVYVKRHRVWEARAGRDHEWIECPACVVSSEIC